MRTLGRRRFLCCIGASASGLSLPALFYAQKSFDEATWADENSGDLRPVKYTSRTLGALVSITAFHRNESQAHQAVRAAFRELELTESLMSIYRPDSQLSRLNRDRVLDRPHPYLLAVLHEARSVSESTNGAFDITVQPLWELYATAQNSGRLPSDAEVDVMRGLVNWTRVECTSDRVLLRGDGTRITLNGIAQGFAADRVVSTLRDHGIEHALVDTGEIGVLGVKPKDDSWTVGIQHPRENQAFHSIAELAGRCLATSGDYATTFSSDYKHHHLLDPRTGRSPDGLSSVSIVADHAMQADALSTAVFVLGLEKASALLREIPGTDAMLVTKDGRTIVTEGFPVA